MPVFRQSSVRERARASPEDVFVSGPDGQNVKDIRTLGGTAGSADSINDSGTVVGGALTADQSVRAFLYLGGKMYDLNNLTNADGKLLTEATGINNAGLIAGDMLTPGGIEHAFLLTPTPEPASIGLAGIAIAVPLGYGFAKGRVRSRRSSKADSWRRAMAKITVRPVRVRLC